MNQVNIIGRLTRDPEVRYTSSNTAFANFSVAIDRGKDKNGNDKGADYPNVKCAGRLAERVEKYCYKGMLVGVSGRIETGFYEKDGQKVYVTDIFADRVEFLSKRTETQQTMTESQPAAQQIPEGFSQLTDDDIPFDRGLSYPVKG